MQVMIPYSHILLMPVDVIMRPFVCSLPIPLAHPEVYSNTKPTMNTFLTVNIRKVDDIQDVLLYCVPKRIHTRWYMYTAAT